MGAGHTGLLRRSTDLLGKVHDEEDVTSSSPLRFLKESSSEAIILWVCGGQPLQHEKNYSWQRNSAIQVHKRLEI